MEKELVNRVAQSGLFTLNLEEFYAPYQFAHFDLKDFLFRELILREKDFREALKIHDWSQYKDKVVLLYCSTDAIIPLWAYMLVATYAQAYAQDISQIDSENAYIDEMFRKKLDQYDWTALTDRRVVVKGCGEKPIPPAAYLECTRKLMENNVLTIMYGEPCSTVPIYKRSTKIETTVDN